MAKIPQKIKQKVAPIISTAKQYWHNPSPGNYVPYKEIACLGFGGFGVNWVIMLASNIGLNAGNFILGASFNMKPIDLQIMLIVANIVGIPLGIVRSYIYDNVHFKGGKFLPYLKHTALPIVVLAIVFVWIPFENMEYIPKAVIIEIYYLVLNVFLCFYNDAFSFIQQIITPNTQERVNIMSISQIIYSLSPSITNFLIPTIAGLTYGLENINTYRIIYPGFTIVGLIFNYIFFKGVHERIVLPKEKQETIRLADAIREVAKNKYFWITSLAGWLGFLENSYGIVLSWTFVYGYDGKYEATLGIVNTLIGNAALYAMILCPIAIKKIGKRNLLIGSNIINIILLTILCFVYKNIIGVVAIVYLNNFVLVFGNIYMPGINADIRDYHQYKTGVRVDGMFGIVGILGTIIGFGTGLVVPAIYERMGLVDDYSVLYNDEIRNGIIGVLVVASVIGAVINVIPYLFYDLTEEKHRGYVKVLKIRAMLADYRNGKLSDDELVDTMNIIHMTRKYDGMQKLPVSKDALKKAKKLPKKTPEEKEVRKAEIKKAREELRKIREMNDDIGNTPIVMEELTKYSTDRYKHKLLLAEKAVADGKGHYYGDADSEIKLAKKMPKSNK